MIGAQYLFLTKTIAWQIKKTTFGKLFVKTQPFDRRLLSI